MSESENAPDTSLGGVLRDQLDAWSDQGRARSLEAASPGPVDFTSNDVLGLARHPEVVAAGVRALQEHGAGGRASRLLGGGCAEHEQLESEAADWLGAEATLFFPSGYHASLGLVGALVGRGDAICSDALNHASLIDAARLSRAQTFVHRHLDLAELEANLFRARNARRRLVLTESVFSMDGDLAPVEAISELCLKHDAAMIVDEAHAVGVLGTEGAGACAPTEGLAPFLARVVPCGKALGGTGAFVAGDRTLVEWLIHRARTFVFTTAPSPAVVGALRKSIELCRSADEERAHVISSASQLANSLGLRRPAAAIVPVPRRDEEHALESAAALTKLGFDVRAVRPPTTPTSRLRIVLHAFNSSAEVDELSRHLAEQAPQTATPAAEPAQANATFVVGTDTDIGKTVVSALLVRAARAIGPVRYWKPVQTGEDSDTESVVALAELPESERLRPVWSLPLPASPHTAAADAGIELRPSMLADSLRGLRRTLFDVQMIVEMAGGLLVPYDDKETQADWLEREGLPTVLVARSGLGTLNHTLLTLEAMRRRHLEPRALFLVGEKHTANYETLVARTGIPHVFELPRFENLGPEALDAWLADHDLEPVLCG